mmetsp:Transcript_77610/g.122450  ORF Transcript_77610/g.122450 Transcript_77610/m.122450 type:complete len:264 (-) Transcript_77610:1083-1874(-)
MLSFQFQQVLQEHGTLLVAVFHLEVLLAIIYSLSGLFHGLTCHRLEVTIGDVHPDMVRLAQQLLPHLSRVVKLLLTHLKVNKALPDQLWHVQALLIDCECAKCPCSLNLAHRVLEVHIHCPSFRIMWMNLQKLAIDCAASVDVAQAHLQVRVVQEDSLLLALRNGPAVDASCTVKFQLPHLKFGIELPDLCKGELLVGDHLQQRIVDGTSLLDVSGLQLLEKCEVNPEIDVSSPKAFLHHRWFVPYCALISLSYPGDIANAFL